MCLVTAVPRTRARHRLLPFVWEYPLNKVLSFSALLDARNIISNLPLAMLTARNTLPQFAMTAATASVPSLKVASFSSSCCICPASPALKSRNCFNDSNSLFFSLMRACRADDCEFCDPPSPRPEEGRIVVGRGANDMFDGLAVFWCLYYNVACDSRLMNCLKSRPRIHPAVTAGHKRVPLKFRRYAPFPLWSPAAAGRVRLCVA